MTEGLEGLNLWFDAELHQYRKGGPEGPILDSITQTLEFAGLVDTTYFTPGSAQRGTDIHELCEDYDNGLLTDEAIEAHEYGKYIKGWKKFTTEMDAKWSKIEWKVADYNINVAGTIDRVGTVVMDGVRRRVIVDIKSGSKRPSHSVQLAAYHGLVARALVLSGEHVKSATSIKRAAVYITKAGNYKFVEFTDPNDQVVWNAAIVIGQYRVEKNII